MILKNWPIISAIASIIFAAGIIWANTEEARDIRKDVTQIKADVSYIKGYIEAKK